MSEMVERLSTVFAEAIADGEDNAEYFARLALTTLREPTDEMKEAGYANNFGYPSYEAWQAMIDAALVNPNTHPA
jgi:hypothetical protein